MNHDVQNKIVDLRPSNQLSRYLHEHARSNTHLTFLFLGGCPSSSPFLTRFLEDVGLTGEHPILLADAILVDALRACPPRHTSSSSSGDSSLTGLCSSGVALRGAFFEIVAF